MPQSLVIVYSKGAYAMGL